MYIVTKNNFVFSDNYELTQVREIDDYALQLSMFQMRTDMENSELRKLIFRFDYSYGWLYWIIYSGFGFLLGKLNLSFISQETLIIFASRQLTLIIFLATLLLVYFILKNLDILSGIIKSGVIYIALLFILYSPGLTGYVVSVKPVILSIFLMYLAIFVLIPILNSNRVKPGSEFRKIVSAILFGLAAGTKITIIFSFPIILVLLLQLADDLKVRKFLMQKKTLLYLSFFILSFVFAISPSIYITPVKSTKEILNLMYIFTQLSAGGQQSIYQGLNNFIASTQAISPGIIPLIIIAFMLIYKLESRRRLFLGLYLLPYTLIFFLAVSLGNGVEWVVSYSLGISFLLYLAFILALYYIFDYEKVIVKILFICLLGIIPFNYLNNYPRLKIYDTYTLNHFSDKYNFLSKNGTLKEISLLKEKYGESFFINKVVLQDYQTPLIWSNFRTGMRNVLIYDNWDETKRAYGEVTEVIILKKNKNYSAINASDATVSFIKNGKFGKMICRSDYQGDIHEIYLCK